MVWFSEYEFYNKLLGSVILFRVTSTITWTQPYIYIHWIKKSIKWDNLIMFSFLNFYFKKNV